MAIIPALPYTFVNGTTADATQVNANFTQILSSVNTNAAANGVNADITQLTNLVSLPSGVTATTQATSDSSTKLATTAFVQAVMKSLHPVGSLYLSTSSANPSTYLGFGTWTAYAAGRAIVGVGSYTDANGTLKTFDTITTQGEYNHTLTTPEIPNHTHTNGQFLGNIPAGGTAFVGDNNGGGATSDKATSATGGGGAHNNIQPSIGAYIWLRTA